MPDSRWFVNKEAEVNTKRFICQFAIPAHFRAQVFGLVQSDDRHKADTTGVGDGRSEFRLCDPPQPTLDDGPFDIIKCCNAFCEASKSNDD